MISGVKKIRPSYTPLPVLLFTLEATFSIISQIAVAKFEATFIIKDLHKFSFVSKPLISLLKMQVFFIQKAQRLL